MAKTTKKLIALLLAVVMITTLISPSNYSWSNAAETRGGDAYATATDSIAMLSSAAVTGNLEDYITGATIADKAGNIYGSSSRPATTPLPVDPNDPTKAGVDIQMSMDIVFPENVVNSIVESGEDATFTYTMPDTIKFNSDIMNKEITDGSGNRIGSYSVVNGVLTATIDHTALKGGAQLKAFFKAWIDMDLTKYNEKNQVENKFTSTVIVTVDVDFKPDVDVKKTASEGRVTDPKDGYVYFDYTVEVSSKHGSASEDLNFSDVIANDIAGVTPEVTDIKVIKSDNTDCSSSLKYNSSTSSIEGTLPALGAKESYKITYTVKSKVDDLSQDVINLNQSNIAEAENSKVDDKDQTSKGYKYVKDGATDLKVTKSLDGVSNYPDNHKIIYKYKVIVSSEYGSDGDITLDDILANELDSKLGSDAKRTVQNVTCKLKDSNGQYTDVTSNGYVTPATGTIGNGDTVIKGNLPKLDANSQYEITYEVVVSDIADDIGSIKVNNKNGVDVSDDSHNEHTDNDSSTWYNAGKSTASISKTGSLSGDKSTITWTVTVNADKKKDLTGMSVSDILTKNGAELTDEKTCSVSINDTDVSTTINLPASFVEENGKLYLTDGTSRVEVTENKSKIVFTYTTDSSKLDKLTDVYKNVATIEKNGVTDSAEATVEVTGDSIKKEFVSETENDDTYTLAWKSTISGVDKLNANDTYTDSVTYDYGALPKHYFTADQINGLIVSGLTEGVDYNVKVTYTNFSNVWGPYSTTVDSVADIPASSDNYITGYTIEFLRDITGTEETPIDYVITYNTTVKSDSKYTAVNKGTLTIDGSSKTSQDSHPVSGITQGSIVEKYSYTNGTDEKESIVGYDKANNVFVYKVVLNGDFAYGDGDRLSFTDTLPAGTELDTTYLKRDMLPEGVGETVGQDGIYFVSYYSDNKTRPQTGAYNFVENFNVASNSISFDIKSLQFYGKNVKVVVYYAVKVTKDISSVVGGSDVEFTNNCSATVVRTDGSTKTKDDSAKVTVTGPNITKTAGNYDNDTNSIEYTVYINEKGEALGNTGSITVVDKYDYSNAAAVKRVFIKDGSLKLLYADTGAEVPADKYSYTYADDTTAKMSTLTLTMPDETKFILKYTYTLVYTGKLTADVKNSVGILGSTSSADSSSTDTNINDQDSSMGTDTEQFNLSIIKTDSIMTGIKLAGAKFELYRYGDPNNSADTNWNLMVPGSDEERVTNEQGRLTLSSLYYNYYYKLIEVEAPEGYKKLTDPIYIYENNISSSLTGPKPAEVTTDSISDIVLDSKGSQNYTLPVDNTPENRKITVKKVWKDAAGGTLKDIPVDSITVKIYASTNPSSYDKNTDPVVKTITLNSANKWTSDEIELKVADANGNYLYYFAEEDFDNADYQVTISNNGTATGTITITNTNTKVTNETVDIPVTKKWDDSDNVLSSRPKAIKVTLATEDSAGNITKIVDKTLTLSASNNWSGAFTDLDKKDSNGKLINYTVVEDDVEGYTSNVQLTKDENDVVTAATITNKLNVGSLVITKFFSGDLDDTKLTDAQKKQITFTISGPEGYKGPTTVTYDQFYLGSYVINNAPYGKYTVTETSAAFDGYTHKVTYTVGSSTGNTAADVVISSSSSSLVTVANEYKAFITVSGTKVWDDNNNQDGKRAEDIKVRLMNGTTEVASKTVTPDASGNWDFSFDDLPKYDDNGDEIAYTVTEDAVAGYDTKITGDVKTGFVITNSHTPETIDISGTKTWNDADNQDGKRAPEITVRLLANGNEVASKEVSKNDNWKYKFTDLPKYRGGNEIKYTITEDTVEDYSTDINGYDITNSYTPGKTSISVLKEWNDADNQDGKRATSVKVKLVANGIDVTNSEVTLSADNQWKHTWNDLPQKSGGNNITYTVKETSSIDGYSAKVTGDAKTGFVVTNSHKPETIDIEGTKTWDDNDNQDGKRPREITVRLLANGTETATKTVTKLENWKYSFTGLPKYSNGQEIKYTITEDSVEGYTAAPNGYDITNTHVPEVTDVKVTKIWNDAGNQDGKRATEINVKLYADGSEVAGSEVTLKADNNWTYTWKDLAVYKNGTAIAYTVDESTTVTGYTKKVTGDAKTGFVITNSYTPETINIAGTKTWNDANNQDRKRPESITVNLLADGQVYKTKTVTESDGWKYSFTDLPKYSGGNKIIYTITEDAVGDYATVIDGYNITNTYTPAKTSISVTKSWNDAQNQDGKRPETVKVQLVANGTAVADSEKTLSAANNWTYTWTDLAVYDNGTAIDYTVEETDIANGYTPSITGDMTSGYIVTNSYTPETTSIDGVKIWDDNNNQDGKRPTSITVNLFADGTKIKSLPVTAADDWKFSFTDLPKYAAGAEITYEVTEDAVTGYTTAVAGDAENGYTFTNSHTPETVDIDGTKTWNDAENQDGKRPTSINVKLLANGSVYAEKEVTEADGWKYSFTDLPKYSNGNAITYTITEDAVEDYKTVVSGYDITNSYTPGKTSVSVTKAWDDANNQDGKRATSIKVRLLADGSVVAGSEVDLSDANNWNYTWSDLDINKSGSPIEYTVEEITAVEGYTTVITGTAKTGYIIKNSYTPETTSISGKKIWNDANDQDGKRPGKITVNLLANGVKVDDKEVTAANDWNYSFTDLPKYAGGNEITYSVTENAVEDYQTLVNGYDITNSYTPRKTSVSVTKAWDDADNQDGKRESSVKVELLADGTPVVGSETTLSADNNWTYTWAGLDVKKSGVNIVYSVREITAIDGYTTTVTGDAETGFTIKNSYTPETTSVSGSKTWNDADDQDGKRPGNIKVNLLADGSVYATKTVTEAENWEYSFTNLPKYRDGGIQIKYSVSEVDVPEYTGEVTGYNITNSYTPGKTSVSVTKKWSDNDNQDGKRTPSVKVRLLADGQVVDGSGVTLSEANNWTHTWSSLDEKKNGQIIKYTVEETTVVDGYTTTITGDATGGYVVENQHTPETVDVSGAKTWADDNDQYSMRPASITVKLLADDVVIKSIDVTEANNWEYSFTDLPKYRDNGVQIKYSVAENPVYGYTTTVNGYDITNTIMLGSISFTKAGLYKESCAKNPNDVKMLDGVEFSLYDGSDTAYTNAIATAKSVNGTVTFDKLKLGTYLIKETKTVGNYIIDDTVYKAEVTEENVNTYASLQGVKNNTLVNDLPRTDIKIEKVAEEDNGVRLPNSVYGLYKKDENGKEELVAEATTDSDGVLKFEGILVGTEYTIKEIQAPDGSYVSEQPISIKFKKDENGNITVESFDGGFNTDSGKVTARVDENGNITWLEPSVKYSFEKVDEDGNPVKGAALRIEDADGKLIDEWVTDGNVHEVNRVLAVGKTYTLIETEAPEGYELAEDIEFTVSDEKVAAGEDVVVTITMVDKKSTTTTETTTEVTTTETTTGTTTETTTEDHPGPNTGDGAPIIPIAVILFVSLAGCGVIVIGKRRKEKQNNR